MITWYTSIDKDDAKDQMRGYEAYFCSCNNNYSGSFIIYLTNLHGNSYIYADLRCGQYADMNKLCIRKDLLCYEGCGSSVAAGSCHRLCDNTFPQIYGRENSISLKHALIKALAKAIPEISSKFSYNYGRNGGSYDYAI